MGTVDTRGLVATTRHDSSAAGRVTSLSRWIDPDLRGIIEDRYWAPIERLTSLEAMLADESFRAEPGNHIGIYSDHGPAHTADVAAQAASLGTWVIDTFLGARSSERAAFVTGTAVLLSLLHDVGMCTVPPVGRRLHAQYAAQLVYSSEFADVLEHVLRTDAGRLRTTIERSGVTDVRTTACEVLAGAVAHSKSSVPASVLDDRVAFRRLLQYVTRTELVEQCDPTDPAIASAADAGDHSFGWLVDDRHRDLADDVIAAIRIVRAADALRQRGTTQRTSSGFEAVVDPRTGRAIIAMRSSSRRSTYLVAVDNPITIGESNIRSAELLPGALRFEVHRGAFASGEADARVVEALAGVVDDIQRDVLPAFPGAVADIVLVAPTDDPSFAERLREAFVARRPGMAGRTRVVDGSPPLTRPAAFDWRGRGWPVPEARRPLVLERMRHHGLKVEAPVDRLFRDVVVVDVAAGETVIEPGEAAAFVAVPFAPGLVASPIGGFRPSTIEPWVPVGTVGVLRGHDRNSTVTAVHSLELMVIPAAAYLEGWAEPYELAELIELLHRDPPR